MLRIRITETDPHPDSACHFDADPDPDPAWHFHADPDPTFQYDGDPEPQHCMKVSYTSSVSKRD